MLIQWLKCGLIFVAIAIAGCATTDFGFDPVFDDFERGEIPTAQPHSLPDPPAAVAEDTESITFDRQAIAIIQQAWVAGDANYDLVERQNTLIAACNAERDALVMAGQARETQIQILLDRERMNWWYTWFYRGGLLMIGLGALL